MEIRVKDGAEARLCNWMDNSSVESIYSDLGCAMARFGKGFVGGDQQLDLKLLVLEFADGDGVEGLIAELYCNTHLVVYY